MTSEIKTIEQWQEYFRKCSGSALIDACEASFAELGIRIDDSDINSEFAKMKLVLDMFRTLARHGGLGPR